MAYDAKKFDELEEYGDHLRSAHTARDEQASAMMDIYNCDWSEGSEVAKQFKGVRVTISPDGANAIDGASRLVAAAEPQFRILGDQGQEQAEQREEDLEELANAIIRVSGKVRGDAVHYDVVRSALLFSEIHLSYTSTSDLMAMAKGAAPAVKRRLEEVNKRTPYLIDVHDPRGRYPDMDNMGLRGYYVEESFCAKDILEKYGTAVQAIIDDMGISMYDQVVLCDLWDLEYRQVWLKGSKKPILQEKHGLSAIPYIVHLVEGGRGLFKEPEFQRRPFLYKLWKSGLWNRTNLSLTVMYTMIFGIGANPQYIHKQGPVEAQVVPDFSMPAGVLEVPYGHEFGPMNKGAIIDPSIMEGFKIATDLGTESTIFKQALGQPLGSGTAYSTVALLNMAGRLPLVPVQQKAGEALADVIRAVILRLKDDGGKVTARGNKELTLKAADIPDYFEIDCELDIVLPQERLQLANIINQLQGKVSEKWLMENILGIGQVEEMREQLWTEQAEQAHFAYKLQEHIQKMQQQQAQLQQMMMMAQQAQQMPPQGGMPPQGMMPQEGEMPANAPQAGALPPEMMEGGQGGPLPPEGMPPEGGMMGGY